MSQGELHNNECLGSIGTPGVSPALSRRCIVQLSGQITPLAVLHPLARLLSRPSSSSPPRPVFFALFWPPGRQSSPSRHGPVSARRPTIPPPLSARSRSIHWPVRPLFILLMCPPHLPQPNSFPGHRRLCRGTYKSRSFRPTSYPT